MHIAAGLTFRHGGEWCIVADGEAASELVCRLAATMRLGHGCGSARQLIVRVEDQETCAPAESETVSVAFLKLLSYPPVRCTMVYPRQGREIICILGPSQAGWLVQIMHLSMAVGRLEEANTALLVHGALAEHGECGVILAGHGGAGKTTASRRLPSGWRALSDDATLVVRTEDGRYWAHPWPTWSRFLFNGSGGSWDVQHAVPLRGLFFLRQAEQDRVQLVGAGESACLLVESAEQAWLGMYYAHGEDGARRLRLRRFDNICALAQRVPCYMLHLSLSGPFWKSIEQVLAGDGAWWA